MLRHLPAWALISLALLPSTLFAKEMVGWVENIQLYPGKFSIKAKIDTGAKTSSINCNCITPIERNGEQWVRFSLTNEQGEIHWFERKILRTVKIKRHFGEFQRRFVVRMGLCLGSTYKETDINLVDRSGLNYQLLIGRRFLQGDYTIDPDKTFQTQPRCTGPFLND